jgi:hypothetical protein
MAHADEGHAALKATGDEYSNVARVFSNSLIDSANVCDTLQFVVDVFNSRFKLEGLKEMVKPRRTGRYLEESKEAAMKCWKEKTTLFYVCVKSVTKCEIDEEKNQHLENLKTVIDVMCDLLLDDEEIQKDIGITLVKDLFEKRWMVNTILDKKGDDEKRMKHEKEMTMLGNAGQQQRDLTLKDCLDDKKLYKLLKGVSLLLENRFQLLGRRPNNDVPDFPSVHDFDGHGKAYYLFGTNKYVGKESDGLTAKEIGNSLVVKDNMGCEVIQEIGSDWCCVHYNSFVVKHRLYKYYVSAGRFKDAPVHRIYIKLPFFEFISPECFFVMQKFPDLYAIAKNVYGVKMESYKNRE